MTERAEGKAHRVTESTGKGPQSDRESGGKGPQSDRESGGKGPQSDRESKGKGPQSGNSNTRQKEQKKACPWKGELDLGHNRFSYGKKRKEKKKKG